MLNLDVTYQRQLRGNAIAIGNSGFLFVQDLKTSRVWAIEKDPKILTGTERESLSAS